MDCRATLTMMAMKQVLPVAILRQGCRLADLAGASPAYRPDSLYL